MTILSCCCSFFREIGQKILATGTGPFSSNTCPDFNVSSTCCWGGTTTATRTYHQHYYHYNAEKKRTGRGGGGG